MADKMSEIHVSWYFLSTASETLFHWQHAVSPPYRILDVNRYLGPVVVYATYLRFPSRPNKISVEQRGSERRCDNRKCRARLEQYVRMYLPAKFAFGRMYAQNRNLLDVITSGLTRLHRHMMHRAWTSTLAHFLISGSSHISRWRRQSADLVLAAVAVSALIFVTSRILFSSGGFFAAR